MALSLKRGVAALNAGAAAEGALLNTGYLQYWTGAQPATPDTAETGNTLLCEDRFGATAFGSPSGGIITGNAVTPGTAVAGGTPGHCRFLKSDHATAVWDGSCGLASAPGQPPQYDVTIDAVPITSGNTVTVDTITYTPNAG
jgi:hypothetical protein